MSERSLVLVTGPARSGKSAWAEVLALRSGRAVTYIATAQLDPDDREWQQRIEQHRQRRPTTWTTLEVTLDLAATIRSATRTDCLLVDSLGTWLANLLHQDDDPWEKTTQELLTSLEQTDSTIILVAEEVGWGIVPAYPVGRQFRDRLGALVRQIGAIAHPVYLVLGGQVLNLSQLGFPLDQAIEDKIGHTKFN
jgi:adenosylcobinamide kinase/adenosylcobinamide-phosphate guanylyltransferase